jgi:hypothetical protein
MNRKLPRAFSKKIGFGRLLCEGSGGRGRISMPSSWCISSRISVVMIEASRLFAAWIAASLSATRECLLVRVKLACGSTQANGRV